MTTNWSVRKDVAGKVTATVYYRQEGYGQAEWLELSESKTTNGSLLSDANGNPRLEVTVDGNSLHAVWIKGPPSRNCSPVTVEKSESPKARFDKIFNILDTAKPGENDAKQAADAIHSLPIFEGLPQLDQKAYFSRFDRSKTDFWKRYLATLADDIEQLPVATETDRQAVASRIHAALSATLIASTQNYGSDAMSAILARLSDRLADVGAPNAAAFDMTDIRGLCARLQIVDTIETNGGGFRLKDLEYVSGLSFDYWTRDVAEAFLDGVPSCSRKDQFANALTGTWDSMQQRQQLITAIRSKRDAMLAMPVTMQTLIDTKNLQPEVRDLKIGFGQSELVDRYLGKPLDTRRDQLFEASIGSIRQQAAAYSPDKPELAKAIDADCEKLGYLPSLSNEKSGRVRQECDLARGSIATAQAGDAVKKVDAAFAAAQPLTPSADAARKVCGDIANGLSSQAAQTVYVACQSHMGALKVAEDAKKCSDAVENSSASPGLLETTIVVAGNPSPTKTTVKEMVCKASEHGIQLAFRSSGLLAWSAQHMDMNVTRGEKNVQLHFLLSPAGTDGGADWMLKVDDKETEQSLQEQQVPVEMVSACFVGSSACQR